MPPATSVTLDLVDEEGQLRGYAVISVLPKSKTTSPPPLLDSRYITDSDPSVEPVQLLEGEEYRFLVHGFERNVTITTDRPEIFEPDDELGQAGRVRPRIYTGTLPAIILADGQEVGRLCVEVRSRKLDYLSHYRWMLRDLADQSAELLMNRFGPTEQQFTPTPAADAKTAYQRFAFLRTLIEGESFRAAIGRILSRPYVEWAEIRELRSPNRGLPSSSTISRQLSRPGPRVSIAPTAVVGSLRSLPKQIEIHRAEETLDSAPNRFVKFVLLRWRHEMSSIEKSLLGEDLQSAPIRRGLREVESTRAILDEFLSHELFREVGELTRLPSGNPVLLGREGYRDILEAYLKFDLAARLSWTGSEDVYGAGQRDVATLYEYWVYLRLGEIISELCQEPFDFSRLIEASPDGLNLSLARGQQQVVSGATLLLGRRLTVALWFNRSFPLGTASGSSWTRDLRPDFSLQIKCLDAAPLVQDEVWLHFDAKYRIDRLEEILGDEDENLRTAAEVEGALVAARRVDLLKMHAYRDAIRRSAGAYVIYPGNDPKTFQEYHEILPGLGAFGLRPTEAGEPSGAGLLSRFIADVISHTAAQLSQHERGRYWQHRVYNGPRAHDEAVDFAPFLDRPPADTKVLLGYVKSQAHFSWIQAQRRYNLRADKSRRGRVDLESRNLGADVLLLYGPHSTTATLWKIVGRPEIVSRASLTETGYPNPGGELYFCLVIEPLEAATWNSEFTYSRVQTTRARLAPTAYLGAPIVVTWLDLASS